VGDAWQVGRGGHGRRRRGEGIRCAGRGWYWALTRGRREVRCWASRSWAATRGRRRRAGPAATPGRRWAAMRRRWMGKKNRSRSNFRRSGQTCTFAHFHPDGKYLPASYISVWRATSNMDDYKW
jgi:hypothetical protein